METSIQCEHFIVTKRMIIGLKGRKSCSLGIIT